MKKNTFKFGGVKLDKINSQHFLVPQKAKKIILSKQDNQALAIALKKICPVF